MGDSILYVLQVILILIEIGTAVVRLGSALLDFRTACLVHKAAVTRKGGNGPENEISSRS